MRAIREGIAKVSLCVVLLLTVAICAHAQQPQQLNMGDVVVATQNGYQVWDPTLPTTQTPATRAIAGFNTAGCAFDSTFRMRAGAVSIDPTNEVVKFGIAISPSSTITQTLGSDKGVSGPPLSIVFDGDNNFFVGIPGATVGNTGTVVEYDASGTKINEFDNLPVDAANFMSLDINKNGKILSYSSGGPNIEVFDTTLPISITNPTQISVTNTATITTFSITNNVVTVQAANNFPAGTTTVTVSGSIVVDDLPPFNFSGQVSVSSVSPTGFSFPFNDGNITAAGAVNNGTASVATTLYGIRELSPFDGSGGYVAAIGLDIANINNAGVVQFLYVNGADTINVSPNWQALAFARDGANFWATNLDNGHLIEFKLAGGKTTGNTFDTGANNDGGFSGVCVVGAFSPAQPTPIMKTVNLCETANESCPALNSNTFTFTTTTPTSTQVSLGNGVTGTSSSTNQLFETMVFKTGQNGPVTVNAWFIEIGDLVGVSDNGVPCFVVDTPTPLPEGEAVNRCAIVKVEFAPDSSAVFTAVNMTLGTSQPGLGARYYSDEANDRTTFVATFPGDPLPGGCHCSTVYSIKHQQLTQGGAVSNAVSCGYKLPITSSPSDHNPTSALPFQFSVANSLADCNSGNILNSSSLVPILEMVKLDTGVLTGTLETAGVRTAGGSTGPYPFYRYDASTNTWVINVKLSSLPTGCYIATTHDKSNQIQDFSYSAVSEPNTVIIGIGQSCTNITLP